MRKKFILIRTLPILVIFILLVFIIKNDLLYTYTLEANSTLGQQSSSFHDDRFHSIYDAIDSINSMLRRRAYSESQVNETTLYESLALTKTNLDQQGYLCKSAKGNIFVGLMSKANSFERRNLIRDTLGRQVNQSNQKMLFFVGESTNETVNELVDAEFDARQDIVRLEFVDDYYNLTLKTLSFLQYFDAYCDNFKFAIKLDDDVFLNWHGMQEFLLERTDEKRPTIYCKVNRRARVIRDSSNKWYMDRKKFPAPVYPNYCGGPSYILNRNAVRRVLEQHEKVKKESILFLEDVYATGICTFQTEIRLVSETKFLNKWYRRFFLKNYLNHTVLAIHPIVDSYYSDMYREVENLYKFL